MCFFSMDLLAEDKTWWKTCCGEVHSQASALPPPPLPPPPPPAVVIGQGII